MKYQVLIFDWDGTLLDSAEHIAQCMVSAFADLGLPVLAKESAKNIIGLGMVEAITRLQPGLAMETIVEVRARYAEHFFKKPFTREDLFSGAIDLLEAASAQGKKLAIATGKSRPGMDAILDSLDMVGYFHSVRCADETQSKPHPQMLEEILAELAIPVEQALMIGDTEYDMEMAQNIGMDRVAVSYGVHSPERLLRYQPLHCVGSIAELYQLLK